MSDQFIKDHFESVKKIILKKVEEKTNTIDELNILTAISFVEDRPQCAPMLFRLMYNKSCPAYTNTTYLKELIV